MVNDKQFAEAVNGKQYWNEISGVLLDPKLVKADRKEELKFSQAFPRRERTSPSEVQGQEIVFTG